MTIASPYPSLSFVNPANLDQTRSGSNFESRLGVSAVSFPNSSRRCSFIFWLLHLLTSSNYRHLLFTFELSAEPHSQHSRSLTNILSIHISHTNPPRPSLYTLAFASRSPLLIPLLLKKENIRGITLPIEKEKEYSWGVWTFIIAKFSASKYVFHLNSYSKNRF